MINWNLQILNICGNFECTNMTDHIFEMAGLGLFGDYFFVKSNSRIRFSNELSSFSVNMDTLKMILTFVHAHINMSSRIFSSSISQNKFFSSEV